jgi:hypothetical protein
MSNCPTRIRSGKNTLRWLEPHGPNFYLVAQRSESEVLEDNYLRDARIPRQAEIVNKWSSSDVEELKSWSNPDLREKRYGSPSYFSCLGRNEGK